MTPVLRFCEPPALEKHLSISGCVVIGARFDHSLLSPTCLAQSEIELPPSIQRSTSKRQAEFLAGRLCARKALKMLTGISTVPGQRADRSPHWPASVCGSITHNQHRALAVVGRQECIRSLGIDIETPLDPTQSNELAPIILGKTEHDRFLHLPQAQRSWLLTLTFSLKESLYKALYPLTKTQFYFEHAELLDWSSDGHAKLQLLYDLSDEFRANTKISGRFCMLGDDLVSYITIS